MFKAVTALKLSGYVTDRHTDRAFYSLGLFYAILGDMLGQGVGLDKGLTRRTEPLPYGGNPSPLVCRVADSASILCSGPAPIGCHRDPAQLVDPALTLGPLSLFYHDLVFPNAIFVIN